MKLKSLLTLITIISLAGCSSYPPKGQGGLAELGHISQFSPVSSNQPLGPEHGLRFDWHLTKLHLDMLVQEGANYCFPAAVLQGQIRQNRIARELEAGLLRDAANDIIIQRQRLAELEQDLTYVLQQADCQFTNQNNTGIGQLPTQDIIEQLYHLLNSDNQFALDSSEINPKYVGRLSQAVEILKQQSDLKLLITGHADALGSQEYNNQLALDRAEQVERYLLIFGLPSSRIETQSVGSNNPLFQGDSKAVRLTNRRVSIEILSNNGDITQ